ncbi:MAG: FMN-binding protein [Clostridiales bacterium]|jgi:major membrane immunogen (membrane-anchored lipoprotein)|nr:FMN-binding protein [Clostridiales bacterium]
MKVRYCLIAAALCAVAAILPQVWPRNANTLRDGYYSAEASEFDSYGWKEFVTIYVRGGRIITVEYNAYNASGFIKSWDMNYMRVMNAQSNSYPNKYTRAYAADLLETQRPNEVDVITGATTSGHSFRRLSALAIARAKAGDTSVAFIKLSEE